MREKRMKRRKEQRMNKNHLRRNAQQKQTNKRIIDHCKHRAARAACSRQTKQQDAQTIASAALRAPLAIVPFTGDNKIRRR